ncbi:hypothetical protein SLS62_002019 [Diatrype stigma]|uniref:Uncharacterized protein n=1 Tax=Diatrype stigma TaxID=117547 RepID=A0AAN9UYT5_9PEZI
MSKCDDDASDTAPTAASTGWGLPTPSHTVVSDDANGLEKEKVPDYGVPSSSEAVPLPGNTYVIRARDSGLAIAIERRELKLMDWDCADDKSFHWECEERGGWLAFKNTVGCKYIGHNGGGLIYAQADWHLLWESFCPRKHPEGGFLLMNRGWWWWNPLQYMDVDASGRRLIQNSSKGTVWEFLKV